VLTGVGCGSGCESKHQHRNCGVRFRTQCLTRPRFYVDAVATRGDAGSPVFLCNTAKFAGLVFAPAADTISIFDDSKQRVATVPYGSGLAACIPASVIREFLEKH
jgi:hypothetical protein